MKDVRIGPVGGNHCCTCCGKCSEAGGHSSTLKTCPSHCCPCPPTGNVCVQFADLDGHGLCPNLMATCITLGPAVVTGSGPPYTYTDVYTSLCPGPNNTGPERDVGGNSCYYPDVYVGCETDEYGNSCDDGTSIYNYPFDKWGKVMANPCNTGTCNGEIVDISLCCCDTLSSAKQAAGFGDTCHACRYQFTWNWQYQAGTSDYCSCPTLGPFEQYILPVNGGSDTENVDTWELVNGVCGSGSPTTFGGNIGWTLTFKLTGQWNCDCCQGGGDIDTSPELTVYAIITPEPPEGCCDDPTCEICA